MTVPRALNPATNPAGWLAAVGAVAAAVVMITSALQGHGLIDPAVIIAAVGAVGALLTRHVVTPVADPKNSAGVPLVPAPPGPPIAVMPAEPARPPSWPSSVLLIPPGERAAGPATVPVTTLPPPPAPPEPPAS